MNRQPIAAVIFDLGGVLVELGSIVDDLGVSSMTDDEFWSRWLASPAVRDFESGRCDPWDFGRRLAAEFDLGVDPGEVVDRFRRWPSGLFPGAADLVRSLSGVIVGALSNSNAIHWQEQQDADVIRSLFDTPFLSHELGLLKPDREVFVHVQSELGLESGEILFLDDNRINVAAAHDVGWRAEVTKGPEQATAHLRSHGLVH